MSPPAGGPRELHAALALGVAMTLCLVAILVTTVLAMNRPHPEAEPADPLTPPAERAEPGAGEEPAVHDALRRLLA